MAVRGDSMWGIGVGAALTRVMQVALSSRMQNVPGTRQLSTAWSAIMPKHRLLHHIYVLALPDNLQIQNAL